MPFIDENDLFTVAKMASVQALCDELKNEASLLSDLLALNPAYPLEWKDRLIDQLEARATA